jgi:predicted HicB family RNase H-like nuclease
VEFNVNLQFKVTYCRLDKNISEQLKEIAKRRGISVETLVNLWLQDKLQEDKV